MDTQLTVIVPRDRLPELYELLAAWHRQGDGTELETQSRLAHWTAGDTELAGELLKTSSSLGSGILIFLMNADERNVWTVERQTGQGSWGYPVAELADCCGVTPSALSGATGSLAKACAKMGRRPIVVPAVARLAEGDGSFAEAISVKCYAMPLAAMEALTGSPPEQPPAE